MVRNIIALAAIVVAVSILATRTTTQPLGGEERVFEMSEKSSERVEEVIKPQEQIAQSVISPYDPIFKEVCWVYENDWRLMSAIAYHESRFRPDVTSSQGAQGMMQIMPRVAKSFGVEGEDLTDVKTNIMVANMLVNRIESMLKFPASTPQRDKMGLILASYNGGIGYVFNAQKLARRRGENPYSWSVIAKNLREMNCSEFATQNGVKHFRGVSQTLAYVDNVIGHYYHYCEIAVL